MLRPSVPAPPERPLPLSGFLRAVRTNALMIWPAAAYEEAFVCRRFLGRTNILVNDPGAIHRVLIGNAENYRRSRASIRILRPVTGQGLLLSDGEPWKLQRRTIAPALAPRMMPMLAGHVLAATDAVVAKLGDFAGQSIDLLATTQNLALDIAGQAMFSLQMEQHAAEMRALLDEFARSHARPGLLDMLLPASVPTFGDFKRSHFRRRWIMFIDAILAGRMREPPPDTPRDLLDLLRAARDPDTGAAFSPAQLRDQVATLILAGHETTAVTLFWAIVTLAQAQAEQDRAADEAAGAKLDSSNPNETMPRLVFTRAVINETLRLYPPAFTIVREAISADQLGPFSTPAKSIVMIAPWVLHRHRRKWTDPDAFVPSRFLPDQTPPARFDFLPFGAGPRVCVGAQFAMTEAVLALSVLVRNFRFHSVDPVQPAAVITTQPDHAARVHISRR